MVRCPGQDQRFWKLGDIFDADCPHCGTSVEFWKDEPSVKCPQCRKVIVNPKLDLGCAQWCRYAEQCLGALADPQSLLCKKLIKEMKSVLGSDEQRIDHALAVFKNAQQILAGEPGDARVVSAAAILHCIDARCCVSAGWPCSTHESEPADGLQDDKVSAAVREILARCAVDAEQAQRICELIANHRSGKVEDTLESKILWDAEWLAKIGDHSVAPNALEAKGPVLDLFKTPKGRDLASGLIGPDIESL
jgi:HD superfamily phosphohydrolase YqeK